MQSWSALFTCFTALSFLFFCEPALAEEAKPVVVFSPFEIQEEFSGFDFDAYTLNLDSFMTVYEGDDTEYVLLDLRSVGDFQQSHIKGALHFGADIDESKLQEIIPSKDSKVLIYCSNSLMPTRMFSLANVSLPQFHALGYENTYMLGAVWDEGGYVPDLLPMVPGE